MYTVRDLNRQVRSGMKPFGKRRHCTARKKNGCCTAQLCELCLRVCLRVAKLTQDAVGLLIACKQSERIAAVQIK